MLIHEKLKIYKVKLPLPFIPREINCYAIKGKNGWSLIDSGFSYKKGILGWQEFMQTNGIKPQDINGIYLTHSHLDHYCLTGWLQQLSGAPVYISALEAKAQERYRKAAGTKEFSEVLLKNGIPTKLISTEMETFMISGMIPEQEQPELTIIKPGEKVLLGDFEYSVVLTPGHTNGHTCFHNEKYGILLSGDHILPEITTNIGLWPWTATNPISDYLDSLESCRSLNCRLVLPAHGNPFSNLAERISVLREIYREKLDLAKSFVVKETTVYKVVLQVYGEAVRDINLALAMGTVYAQLTFLCNKGELKLTEKEGKSFFSLPG